MSITTLIFETGSHGKLIHECLVSDRGYIIRNLFLIIYDMIDVIHMMKYASNKNWYKKVSGC